MTERPEMTELGHQLGHLLDDQLVKLEPVAGGDVAQAFCARLGSGRSIFVKTHSHTPLCSEAAGLSWLAEADALRTPTVLGTGQAADAGHWLALELITPASQCCADYHELLGRGLARLHACTTPRFGWHKANFIGSLEQSNTCETRWSDFYRKHRLEPLLARAAKRGLAPSKLRARFATLWSVLDQRCGPNVTASRLHGDLWAGNVMHDEHGRPVLIDPSVYAGHREIDLAMMRLFGGFEARCFAAYHEAWPLDPQWQERVALYQLYPLLVHLNMFGSGYLGQLESALDSVL